MLPAADLQALLDARHPDPFAVLGPHRYAPAPPDSHTKRKAPSGKAPAAGKPAPTTASPSQAPTWVRAFLPGAVAVDVLPADPSLHNQPLASLPRRADTPLFEGPIEGPIEGTAAGAWLTNYRLRIDWGTHTSVLDDPYRYGPLLTDHDVWLLAEGSHQRPFEVLGAHRMQLGLEHGVRFAVWAPHAQRVSVIGSFNQWDGRRHPMRLRPECGVWELFIPGLADGDAYLFELLGADGTLHRKSDPYAFAALKRPDIASLIHPLPAMRPITPQRQAANRLDAPVSIYEVHLGSWRRHADGSWLSYEDLAAQLIDYVADLGFTHIELLPITEHPLDESWGYQPIGLYAPTSRFGSPEAFAALVAAAHAKGLGVLLDWVPAHFPSDPHGLGWFDGQPLYEYADPREGFHRDWNTLIFNFARTEVRNLLIGNALYWLERYGLDGLRVDAVASMLYRDYSREAGAWIPNREGGRENLEAISFLQLMNRRVGTERPGTMTVAEESTDFPGVSRPPSRDGRAGLGFHFKWNMGWMHDTLRYLARDPIHRKHHHNELTFAMMYAYNENYVLPLSHDEVVHGKRSLLGRMPGDSWQRFANLRAYYGYMWGFPGKKLLFMGGEFAQEREWNCNAQLDWFLLDDPTPAPGLQQSVGDMHRGVQRLVKRLNQIYRAHPALSEQDFDPQGFQWIRHDDAERSVLSFERIARDGSSVVVVSNFTPVPHRGYPVGVRQTGPYQIAVNSDATQYGGSGWQGEALSEGAQIATQAGALHGRGQHLSLDVPPLATVMLIAPKRSASATKARA